MLKSVTYHTKRTIAEATAQIERLQIVVAALEKVGLDSTEARDVLDEAQAHLALLRRQLGVVLWLLQMAKRQKGERRTGRRTGSRALRSRAS